MSRLDDYASYLADRGALSDYLLYRVQVALGDIPLDDGVSEAAPRHVTFYGDPGIYTAGDVGHTSDLVTFRFQFTYTTEGASADRGQCDFLAEKVRAVLIDHVPTAVGHVFGPIEHETALAAKSDPDSTTAAVFSVDTFVVRGSRA